LAFAEETLHYRREGPRSPPTFQLLPSIDAMAGQRGRQARRGSIRRDVRTDRNQDSAGHVMRTLIRRLQSSWLADANFLILLVVLIAVVFILPVIMEVTTRGVLLFNVLLLSVFFSGIFSTRSVGLISISASLFSIHLALRIMRFGCCFATRA
jgi:uncharacterized membrane protein